MESLSSYFSLVSQTKPLTREEELSLLEAIHSDTVPEVKRRMAKDKLLRSCIMFVVKKAKARSRQMDHYAFEELVAAGNHGLCIAINRFKPSHGTRFLTYAGWWVDQCQWRTQQKMRLVSVPVWQQQLAVKIRKILDKEPLTSDQALREACAPTTSISIIANLRKTLYVTVRIDDLLRNILSTHSSRHSPADIDDAISRSDVTLAPLVVDDFSEDLIQTLDEDLFCGRLQQMLTTREWTVISSMFELGDADKRSINQLSAEMQCTVSEVRKLHGSGMKKIKAFYLKKGGRDEGPPTGQSPNDEGLSSS